MSELLASNERTFASELLEKAMDPRYSPECLGIHLRAGLEHLKAIVRSQDETPAEHNHKPVAGCPGCTCPPWVKTEYGFTAPACLEPGQGIHGTSPVKTSSPLPAVVPDAILAQAESLPGQ